MQPLRVMIADDHPLMRHGLRRLVESQKDLVCCGECGIGPATLSMAAESRPDLLVIDLRLKKVDGLELIKSLIARISGIKILIISEHQQSVFAERALRAGALGYVEKDANAQALLVAMRAVLAGKLHLSERIAKALLAGVVAPNGEDITIVLSTVSDRQLQVLYLLGLGLSTREIATELKVSFKTVETHRENLKRRLKLRNASDLIHFAASFCHLDQEGAFHSVAA